MNIYDKFSKDVTKLSLSELHKRLGEASGRAEKRLYNRMIHALQNGDAKWLEQVKREIREVQRTNKQKTSKSKLLSTFSTLKALRGKTPARTGRDHAATTELSTFARDSVHIDKGIAVKATNTKRPRTSRSKTREVSRQALNYVKQDGTSRLNWADPDSPIVLVRGQSYGCRFLISDDDVVHLSLSKDGMPFLTHHEWGNHLEFQDPVEVDTYINFSKKDGFDWYQIQEVDISDIPAVVQYCKELAHLNIKGTPRKPRATDPVK